MNDRYSDPSTQWTLVSLSFNVEISGNKLVYVEMDTALAEVCSSNFTIRHSVYQTEHVNYFEDLFETIPD